MKKIVILIGLLFIITACVNRKIYKKLESTALISQDSLKELHGQLFYLTSERDELKSEVSYLRDEIDSFYSERESGYTVGTPRLVRSSSPKKANPSTGSPLNQQAEQPSDVRDPNILPKGNFGFYCPKKMYYEETTSAFAIVHFNEVEDLIRKKVEAHLRTSNEKSLPEEYVFKEVYLYDYVEVILMNGNLEEFSIVNVHDQNIQKVEEEMEGWHWKVTPVSEKDRGLLILKVRFFDKDMVPVKREEFTQHIEVEVSPRLFLQNSKLFFSKNIEWVFSFVIIPFITFLWGRWSNRKKTQNA